MSIGNGKYDWGRYSQRGRIISVGGAVSSQLIAGDDRRRVLSRGFLSSGTDRFSLGNWVPPTIAGQNDLTVLESLPVFDGVFSDQFILHYRNYHKFLQLPIWGIVQTVGGQQITELLQDSFIKFGGHDAKEYCTYESRAYMSRTGIGTPGPRLLEKRKNRVMIGIMPNATVQFKFGNTQADASSNPFLNQIFHGPLFLDWSDWGEQLEQELYWVPDFAYTFAACIAWEIWGIE